MSLKSNKIRSWNRTKLSLTTDPAPIKAVWDSWNSTCQKVALHICGGVASASWPFWFFAKYTINHFSEFAVFNRPSVLRIRAGNFLLQIKHERL